MTGTYPKLYFAPMRNVLTKYDAKPLEAYWRDLQVRLMLGENVPSLTAEDLVNCIRATLRCLKTHPMGSFDVDDMPWVLEFEDENIFSGQLEKRTAFAWTDPSLGEALIATPKPTLAFKKLSPDRIEEWIVQGTGQYRTPT